jgi:DNA-binding transcriptional regulator YdaS (Cro superfamily)
MIRKREWQRKMNDGLTAAVEAAGGIAQLAALLHIRHQAISQWKARRVPAERVLEIEQATGVPRHELRPDLYRGYVRIKQRP